MTGAATRRGRFVLVATILASAMVFIDGAVVTVALPAVQADFATGVVALQWVVESYLLTLTALLLAGGALGDRIGRRRTFQAGIALFALASAWCGLAPNVNQLILARAVQGIGGALLVPGSLAIITAFFGDDGRGRAIGTWSALTAITTAAAPLLGGWLIDAAGWRWIFYLNLPLAATALLVSAAHVPESRDTEAVGGVDWWGTVLATLGLGALTVALVESSRLGLGDPLIWGGGLAAAAILAAFVEVERRRAHPMLPPALFRDRVFAGANGLTLALYAGLSGAMFFLPLHLISVRGYSALGAGAALLPFVVLLSALSRRMGALADRHGARRFLVAGPALTGLGFLGLAVPGLGGGYWATYFPGIAVMGLGMSLAVAPLTTVVMGAVPASHAGVASGINNAVSRVAGLLAIAVLGIAALARFEAVLSGAAAAGAVPPDVVAGLGDEVLKLGAAAPPTGLDDAVATALAAALDRAALASFRLAMVLSAGLAFAAALVGWATIGGRPRDPARSS